MIVQNTYLLIPLEYKEFWHDFYRIDHSLILFVLFISGCKSSSTGSGCALLPKCSSSFPKSIPLYGCSIWSGKFCLSKNYRKNVYWRFWKSPFVFQSYLTSRGLSKWTSAIACVGLRRIWKVFLWKSRILFQWSAAWLLVFRGRWT